MADLVRATAMVNGVHHYLSTACLHGHHGYCESDLRLDGDEKTPAVCKWCPAPCRCDCGHPALDTPPMPADPNAAIEAATTAIHDVDCPEGSWCSETRTTWGRYGRYARAALDAAAPLIRADERAKVRAELLFDAEIFLVSHTDMAYATPEEVLRWAADRIAPEADRG